MTPSRAIREACAGGRLSVEARAYHQPSPIRPAEAARPPRSVGGAVWILFLDDLPDLPSAYGAGCAGANGSLTLPVAVPADPHLAGATVYAQ